MKSLSFLFYKQYLQQNLHLACFKLDTDAIPLGNLSLCMYNIPVCVASVVKLEIEKFLQASMVKLEILAI